MADVKFTSVLTPSQQIRLESVTLAFRHDRASEDIIKRASDLAAFIEGPKAATKVGKLSKGANDEQVGPDTDLI